VKASIGYGTKFQHIFLSWRKGEDSRPLEPSSQIFVVHAPRWLFHK